jgi:hypothetical protein
MHAGLSRPHNAKSGITDPEFGAVTRQCEREKADDAERKTKHQRRAFADLLGDRPNDGALDNDRCDPNARQRQADGALVKAVAVQHVEHADAGQHGMRKVAEEIDTGKPEQLRM